MKHVIVVGGGLAGLISSILLARKGVPVTLIERKRYPFHRVCGEYISNEVVPFLKCEGIFPAQHQPENITRFQLTATDGRSVELPLDLGGFGISRFAFDHFLFQAAVESGVEVKQNTEVTDIQYREDIFHVSATNLCLQADLVLCAYGKRARLDVDWKRSFTTRRSPYVGIKHHLQTKHPKGLISLHNFEGGYCGISNVEGGVTNLCYLVHRDKLRQMESIQNLEQQVLMKNPHLRKVFSESDFLFERPETINEITFETKEPLFNHLLMLGDAAGMITPLCGNGMAMAIRSGKIAAELVSEFCHQKIDRAELEWRYVDQWKRAFADHLWFGRQVQRLFGSELASNIAIQLAVRTPWIANAIMRKTHGQPF